MTIPTADLDRLGAALVAEGINGLVVLSPARGEHQATIRKIPRMARGVVRFFDLRDLASETGARTVAGVFGTAWRTRR